MSIFLNKHTANYTTLPNAIFRDERLTPDMLGVLCYLLHMPADWTVRQKQLADRFNVGKDKMQGIIRRLVDVGYIVHSQSRNPDKKTFGEQEYHVYDTPQGTGEPANSNEPQPENPATGGTGANTPRKPSKKPQPEKPWPENPPLLNTKDTNPSTKGRSPPEGVLKERESEQDNQSPSQTPTLNARIWAEAKAILSPKEFGCVPGWLQRVNGKPNGPEKLLGIIEAARKAGTPQAVPYITKALNSEFPPPPDPKDITRERWELLVQAAVNVRNWDSAYGPRPGEKGCLVPPDLITPDLVRAVSVRRVA